MNEDLQDLLTGIVDALSDTTSQRDPYTAIHQDRVARLACAIAAEMGAGEEFIGGLGIAGKLHDIGKIAVPAAILSKPGSLSDMEMGVVRMHASASYSMLEHVPFERPVAAAVLQHHERLDGSGYPDGLLEDEILPEAKILAVADVVEAMASHRPYRPALGVEAAIAEVTRSAGHQFDSEVVAACVRVVESGDITL
jgi:HD-GYP domain-containing protein (c-di-GMP phosphodiesterase class II)